MAFNPFDFQRNYGLNPTQDLAEDQARKQIDATRDMSPGGILSRGLADPQWRAVFDQMGVRDLASRIQGGRGVRVGLGGVGLGASVKQGGQTTGRVYGDGSERDFTQPAVQGLYRAIRR